MSSMGKFNDVITARLVPSDALIFYQPTAEGAGGYVEYRRIRNGKFGAASPLSVSTLGNLLQAIEMHSDKTKKMVMQYGRIPDGLLYVNCRVSSYKLVWYHKPEKRMLLFTEAAGVPSGEMMVPGLVYCTDGQSLSIFAFKGKKPSNVLYRAPFFNVYNTGKVCLGSAQIPVPVDNSYKSWMQYWEDMFWKSEFAHALDGASITGDLKKITRECINSGEPFPTDKMVRMNTKLSDLLK